MTESEIMHMMKNKEKWYGDAADYWKNVDPTVDGMLQGYESISDVDVQGSKQFIKKLKEEDILTANCHRAADCGAGIGRVSKHFLLTQFDVVDIVEQCEEFTKCINNYMDDETLGSRIETIYNQGLQEFNPKPGHYDVIWIQWVIGYLTNDDMLCFLKRCQRGLTPGGCIIIKDNVTTRGTVLDSDDSSVTRAHEDFVSRFKQAGVKLLKTETQKGFPSSLFKVNIRYNLEIFFDNHVCDVSIPETITSSPNTHIIIKRMKVSF